MRRRTLLIGTALALSGAAWMVGTLLDRKGRAAAPLEAASVAAAAIPASGSLDEATAKPTNRTSSASLQARAARSSLESAPLEPTLLRKHRPRPVRKEYESTSISGRISTPSGLALEAIMVSAAPDSRRKATKVWTRTDAEGRFEFEVPRRFDLVYRVQVGGTTEDRSLRHLIQDLKGKGKLHVEDVAPGRNDLHFIIPVPGSLTLIAVDSATGVSLRDLNVESRLENEHEFRPHGWGRQHQSPDENGRFSIDLPAGPIVLRLTEPGFVPVEQAFLVPPTRDPLPEVIEFDACARVELTVRMSPGTTPSDFNPELGAFVPRDDLGRPRYTPTVMLLDDEEHERYVQADTHKVDDLWFKQLSGHLRRESRIFDEGDRTRVAWPPPGRYHFAAFPSGTRFDPPILVVGTDDESMTVSAKP